MHKTINSLQYCGVVFFFVIYFSCHCVSAECSFIEFSSRVAVSDPKKCILLKHE